MKKFLFFLFLVFIDQATKIIFTKNLLSVWGGFLEFKYCNPNISWGIPITGFNFFLLWTITMILLLNLLKKENWNIFLIFILAGAISNVIDRLLVGCVIDFINIGQFPSFNLADSFISLGALLFFIQLIKKDFSDKHLTFKK